MLWSPSLQGHRLVYCRVIACILGELGYEVVIAGDVGGLEVANAARLDTLRGGPVVEVRDIGEDLRADGASLAPLWRLVADVDASLAILAEADDSLAALAGRDAAGGGRPAKLLALFIRATNDQYALRVPLARRVARHVRHPAASPDAGALLELLTRRRAPGVVPLVLDERFAGRHAASCRWLPDIYRDPDEAGAAAGDEAAVWRERVRRFAAAAGERPLFVYVGTSGYRRGYDTLLRLALEEDGCVAHCGRFVLNGEPSDEDSSRLRATLLESGRLLETGAPYLEPATADAFIAAARCVVLPYRAHDGSSGIMLQALAVGRPVVVPDRGLMAFRVRGSGLGAVYRDGDNDDLRRRFRELQRRGPAPYAGAMSAFIEHFSLPQLRAALAAAVTGEGGGASLPLPSASAGPEGRGD